MAVLNLLLFLFFSMSSGYGCGYDCKDDTRSLQLVVTMFRHGERTSSLVDFYPKDPYRNEYFFPYGNGQLTNKGKNGMYRLGKLYRKLYGSILGPLYLPGVIAPYTTDFERAQCSLQAFLAGLFSPKETILEWNDKLNWNPIPYTVINVADNGILPFPMLFCPRFQQLYYEYRETPEAKAAEDRFRPLYPYISRHTGINVTTPYDLFFFYFGLNTKKEWGLKLPKWTKAIYPEYMTDLISQNHVFFNTLPEQKQLHGGRLLKKTINDMIEVINNTPNQPKMYIYSSHEGIIVALMGALNIYYPHIPQYDSSIILELHKIKQTYYVKVKYDEYGKGKFVDMEIPGCEILCPFDNFVNLLQDNIPADNISCAIKQP